TTVVQHLFSKLPPTPCQPIIETLWFYDSLSGSGWEGVEFSCLRRNGLRRWPLGDRLRDDLAPGYAKTPATRPDGYSRNRDLPFARNAIPAGRSRFWRCEHSDHQQHR